MVLLHGTISGTYSFMQGKEGKEQESTVFTTMEERELRMLFMTRDLEYFI